MSARQWFTAMVAAMALVGVAGTAAAQWNLARTGLAGGRNHLYTTVGVDNERLVSLGYQRVIPMFGQDWQLDVEAGVPAPEYDYGNYSGRIQLRTTLLHYRSLRVLGSLAAISRGTDNETLSGVSFGADLTTTAGVFRPSWFVAGEFGFDKAAVTRKNFADPNAEDGWFLSGPGTFHYGASAGVAVGLLELSARAGWRYKEGRRNIELPAYVAAGVGVRF